MSSDYEYSDEDVDYYDDEDEDMLSAQEDSDGEYRSIHRSGLPLVVSHTRYPTRSLNSRYRLRSLR